MIFIIMIMIRWDQAIGKDDDDQRDGDEDNLFKVYLCTRTKVIMIREGGLLVMIMVNNLSL